VSGDGALAIVVIALLGNPFSPRYARIRARACEARALDFCALNVAVYGPRGALWSLQERSMGNADRDRESIAIGKSRVGWAGDALVIDIDEQTAPIARPLRGRVTFRPASAPRRSVPLDEAALHTWWPVAPAGRLEVDLTEPSIRFAGAGYHDSNAGDVALEASFARWTWSRARVDDHRTFITYDVTEKSRLRRSLAFDVDGRRSVTIAHPRLTRLPRTRWRLEREAPQPGAVAPRVLRELEDTPFYSRALVETRVTELPTLAMHETLSLDRLARGWVQFLLPFRMGRLGKR
jgi:carotenoid 1,2-hydratase